MALYQYAVMQTFLPYASFVRSAEVLDRQRLGKQRVENLQIMTTLLTGRGWVNHPAVKMWAGSERTLLLYQEVICFEWLRRGFRDSCYVSTTTLYYQHFRYGRFVEPSWLGNEDFHISHQSNLLRKDPQHYGPFFPGVPDDLPYLWPV